MPRIPMLGAAALAGFALLPTAAFAVTASTLSSFGGREEPTVIYWPGTNTFTPDSYPNMTNQGDNTVRMELRYRANEWWDGDRSTSNRDRGRAEVKGLGVHQKTGQTFDYITTWRTNPSFRGSGRFCHFFQLKATDGDSGAPLVVASIFSGQSNAAVRYWPGNASGFIVARNFNWSPATWQELRVRIKTSPAGSATGSVLGSVNGDALQGASDVQVYRPDSTDYRPKWGLYRGVGLNDPIGDDYIDHRNVTVNVIDAPPPPPPPPPPAPEPPPPGTLKQDAELLPLVAVGAASAIQFDANMSRGEWMALLADGPGDYIEYTLSSVPAGTYRLKMTYKAHSSRGMLTLHLNGQQLGGVIDQYSANTTYPEVDFGEVTFEEEAQHVIRLTCVGKNPASGSHTLSADVFFLDDGSPPQIAIGSPIEVEELPYVTSPGSTAAMQNDSKNSGGRWLALQASSSGHHIEFTLPNVPAGTYNLLLKYKSHPGRGILVLHVDGEQLGGSLDQYSSPQNYPEVDFGILRFDTAGDRTIRLTCIGRNPASNAFTLSADTITLVPDTNAPLLELPEDYIVEATGPDGAVVEFEVTAEDAEDGEVPVTVTPESGSTFPLGINTVTATARDFAGNTATGRFFVAVIDTTAPSFTSLTASPNVLWSPNHQMVPVTLTAQVSDLVDQAPSVRIVSVESNEPVNGEGDGNTAPDWLITGDMTVNLRAERSGNGNGRIYTITVEAEDAEGNVETATVLVRVPKSAAQL